MTPGSAVRLASVAKHVTHCATRPGERAICRPECFKLILNYERVKICLFLRFEFPFLRFP